MICKVKLKHVKNNVLSANLSPINPTSLPWELLLQLEAHNHHPTYGMSHHEVFHIII